LKYIFIIIIIFFFYFSKNKTNHLITILEHKPNGACKIKRMSITIQKENALIIRQSAFNWKP